MPTNTTTGTTTTTPATTGGTPPAANTITVDPRLEGFLQSVRLETKLNQLRPLVSVAPADPAQNKLATVNVLDTDDDKVSPQERFISSVAAMVHSIDPDVGRFDKQSIQDLIGVIDELVDAQVNAVIHHEKFKRVESKWTSLADLVENTNFKKDIQMGILDVSKDQAFLDLELNSADIGGSEFFKKLYVAEYDQYGGAPFGVVIGLFEFMNTREDLLWLKTMGKICTAAHAPFISAVAPEFFGCTSMREVSQLRDVYGLLDTPTYSAWNKLRDTEEAAYIGLTLPRYIVRQPYNKTSNPATGINFTEKIQGDNDNDYLWGNAAMLFARNLVKSFETSGWCQHIRGPKGGGRIAGLPVHMFNVRGEEEMKMPVEISIPDFREFELARSGLIPLIQKKGSADAVFFSAQSIKKSKTFKDPKDSENSQLVTNLAYTFSISRIAHYLKCIMRDNIGSTANATYIFTQIDRWISGYVTALVNPDDLTLRYYPFKAYSLEVTDVPGKVGWYKCNLSILPHIQFEGMDVDLRVDARLG
jgi:type VI secretion system protein ImpC